MEKISLDRQDNLRQQKFTDNDLDKLLQNLQRMEKISLHRQDNLRQQKFTDNELDKLLQDLNEFQRTVSMQTSTGNTSFGDFVDSFLSGNINNWNTAHSLQCHIDEVLHDFEEYETKMLPPCQRESTSINNLHNSQSFTSATEIQDSQVMIEEMTERTQDLIVENFHDTSGLNMTSDILSNCDLGRTSGLGIDSFLSSIDSVSFQGSESLSMTSFGVTSVRYFHCKENGRRNGMANIWRRRKYKGVIETEEETACRLELTKIKNREAAAKAHQKKQAHEANLKAKLQRLRKKNQFLRNFLRFLEDDKRNRLSPMPLKRTISGPI